MVRKKATILERKLGREKAYGLYYEDGLIEIDPRQTAKEYLDTCVHELLHHALPSFSEASIKKVSRIVSQGVWQQNFRRIMK